MMKFYALELYPLSRIHIKASELAITNALAIEVDSDNYNKEENYIAYSTSAIISSVAALEANINEQFEWVSHLYSHVPTCANIYKYLKDNNLDKEDKYKGVVGKYILLIELLKKDNNNDQKKTQLDNIGKIIELRNQLVHYNARFYKNNYADTDYLPVEPIEKMRKLLNFFDKNLKITPSPFYGDGKGKFDIPHRIINAKLAEWCLETIKYFLNDLDEYIRRMSEECQISVIEVL
ncbi:MAG: hypothetical protein QTN59_09130 [Candidatus Electrothrix communis]|nr:MAG: hypothetical protein QTN59_09130 [Candidatus Electrothrix communis]